MRTFGRDAGRIVALAVGLAIGLRAVQVIHNFGGSRDMFANGMAQGTLIGLIVAVGFFGGLGLWLLDHRPGVTAGRRFLAFDAGMILGALVGWIVVSASA